MELRKLLKNIKPVAIKGNEDIDVTGVNINSRLIGKGNLFIAMKGTQVDGHRFISGAVEAGAVAVMCEELPSELDNGVTYVRWSLRKTPRARWRQCSTASLQKS